MLNKIIDKFEKIVNNDKLMLVFGLMFAVYCVIRVIL